MDVRNEFKNGNLPNNETIINAFNMSDYRLLNSNKTVVSISGGSDSDIMLDILLKTGSKKKFAFVFFDTGLEYKATKEHIKYLENKYGIRITVVKPKTPIPLAVKRYGQPFLSKQVSEYVRRLQKHGFKWEDKPLEVLLEEYPNCKIGVMWWCNARGEKSSFNINRNKGLKEFLIKNPPKFPISNWCCKCAKKDVFHDFIKNDSFDLSCVGIRKAEGGARRNSYRNCFDDNSSEGKINNYRPIFWFKEEDKREYEKFFNIENSKCYTEYGLKRTGCCGCPYGKDFEHELEVLKKYEPNMFKAVNNIFKDSYEYTRKYNEFKRIVKVK